MNDIPSYQGKVSSVHVALWRGTYEINGIKFFHLRGSENEPLFSADQVRISLDWRALFHGRIVSKIAFESPHLQFIERKTKANSQTQVDKSWQDKAKSLYPFQLNRIQVRNGLLRYKDETSNPKINLFLSDLNGEAENISNVTREADALPSRAHAAARILDSGRFELEAKFNVFTRLPLAEIHAKIRGLSLTKANPFALAYGDFDFNKGILDVTTELSVNQKTYKGYVKTLASSVEVLDHSSERKKGEPLTHYLWEGLVAAVIHIFKNHPTDTFAAKIPFETERDKVKIDTWATIGSILRNTFVKALSPQYEENFQHAEKEKAYLREHSSVSGSTESR